jgi:hypothetical protein
MPDEVDLREECDFLLREAAFYAEEAAIERLRADAADSRDQAVAVVRPQRANFDATSIAQHLHCRVFSWSHRFSGMSTVGTGARTFSASADTTLPLYDICGEWLGHDDAPPHGRVERTR